MRESQDTELPQFTPDQLKARFKKLQQQTNNVYQNWQIRVHRSLSWYKRSLEMPAEQPETKFILLWISLNCLYSRWDAARNAPGQDAAARRDFLTKLCQMDPKFVEKMLRRYRPLLKKLLEDPFLSSSFWRDPAHPKAKGWATADANYLELHLKSGEHSKLLGQAVDRLYVMRGQLVHGAATGGGRLNRKPLGYCLQLLSEVVPLMLHLVLEHGYNDDWPELCYPPIK